LLSTRLCDERGHPDDQHGGVEARFRWQRQQLAEGYDLLRIFQEAARVGPDISKLWSGLLAVRAREKHHYIQALAAGLKPHLSARRATDLYVVLERPEIYEELVLERGWSPENYER